MPGEGLGTALNTPRGGDACMHLPPPYGARQAVVADGTGQFTVWDGQA